MVSAEATIGVLLTEYHLVSMKVDELVTQCLDRVGSLKKRLATVEKKFESDDKMRTLLRGLPAMYASTPDLIRELGKENHQAVAMIVEKEADLKNPGPRVA